MQHMGFLYQESGQKFKDRPAFASRQGRELRFVTYGALLENAFCLAEALIDLGFEARAHAGIFADNREEWMTISMAVTLSGGADVPRASDVTEQDTDYIIPHSDMSVLFVENNAVLSRIHAKTLSAAPALKHLVLIDGEPAPLQGAAMHTYASLLSRGKSLRASGSRRAEGRLQAIRPDHLFTLIYTSGTTGAPKGVMLTHANLISQIERVPIPLTVTDRILSILPVWHIFERVFELIAVANGCCTYYSSVRNLREDFAIVRPTFMASAPRLWENVYQGIRTNLEKSGAVSRSLFAAASRLSSLVRGSLRTISGNVRERPLFRVPSVLGSVLAVLAAGIPFLLLDFLVLRKIRRATGGALRGSCSGGGALPLHVDEFFNNAGIPVLEGYGMTETSPVIAVRTFDRLVTGTVGPLYADTDLRLVDLATGRIVYSTEPGGERRIGLKGEIHVRGPQVMKGYYKNPDATAKVLAEGWMNTGDIGIMTWNGCLRIAGRSKETIVLLGGENVEPVPIENKIHESALVQACVVVGQDQKYLAALVVPAQDQFNGRELADLANSQEAQARVREEIKRLVNGSTGFKSFERVVEVRLLPAAFKPGDELTAKLSVKRHVIHEKYRELIDSIYRE